MKLNLGQPINNRKSLMSMLLVPTHTLNTIPNHKTSMITLILLPGMDGTGDLFAPLLAELSLAIQTRVVPYPRHEALGYAELESYVLAAIPRTGSYLILGESFSGPLAIMIAAKNPQGLIGLILCATFASNPYPRLTSISKIKGLAQLFKMPTWMISSLLLGRDSNADLRRQIRQAIRSVDIQVLHARMLAVLMSDVSKQLCDVDVPVLYLQASRDLLLPRSALTNIQRHKPAMRVATVAAPHCLLQAQAKLAATLIENFVHDLRHMDL